MHVAKQKGVALITVMLILAIVTILAVSMFSQQQLIIHRSSNLLNYEQVYNYLQGGEAWASQLLIEDRKTNQTDSFKDDWAKVLPPMAIEGGQITGFIEDLQGRFNLNNLVQNGQVSNVDRQRFNNLLANLDINQDLTEQIIDWIDGDELERVAGAEDNAYLNLSPAYRAANQMMQSPSELLLIKDFNFETYLKLAPFVCTLPNVTPININTATPQVIRSLSNNLTEKDAEQIAADLKEKPVTTVQEFIDIPAINASKVSPDQLSVISDYFILSASAQIAQSRMDVFSIFERDNNGSIKLLSRSRSVF